MKNNFIILIFIAIFIFGCNPQPKTLIIISKDYDSRVENWLKNIDPTITTKVFYSLPLDSMNFYLENANGIVLGGGEDVNPTLYNKPEYDSLCDAPDNFRDSIETLLIQYAMEHKIPILGICRGNQIMNVVNGGTLIPDIPTFYQGSQNQHRSNSDSAHYIISVKDSWLECFLQTDTIWVNSRHHQSVDELAQNFSVSAFSNDSVIESIEFKDKNLHPFALGVQWHPEGLQDSLSHKIGKLFIDHVKGNSLPIN